MRMDIEAKIEKLRKEYDELKNLAASSNGRTPDFESENVGSSPAAASTHTALVAECEMWKKESARLSDLASNVASHRDHLMAEVEELRAINEFSKLANQSFIGLQARCDRLTRVLKQLVHYVAPTALAESRLTAGLSAALIQARQALADQKDGG